MNYNSMKATKATKQPYQNISVSRKTTSTAKKVTKKLKVNWFVIIFVLVVSVVAGFLVNKFAFKNDIYEMVCVNGEADIILGGDGDDAITTYTEYGVKCVAFGKDCSEDCTVTYYYRADLTQDEVEVTIDDINLSNAGIYYAVYKCPNIKYSSVKLIRNIIVLGGEDNG